MKLDTVEQKEKYLKTHGWCTLWNENNWVHSVIMAGSNLDYCGVGIDDAVKIQQKNENKYK